MKKEAFRGKATERKSATSFTKTHLAFGPGSQQSRRQMSSFVPRRADPGVNLIFRPAARG